MRLGVPKVARDVKIRHICVKFFRVLWLSFSLVGCVMSQVCLNARKSTNCKRNIMWGHRVLAVLFAVFATTGYAMAKVVVRVDLSTQRMHVIVNGSHYATWSVSTGRRGYPTPTGSHRPKLLQGTHYSSKYHGSPMPYSIFFRGGYAIHGTYEAHALGRPVSHGCIRLHPSDAAELFSLVSRHGKSNTQIIVRH